MGEELYCFEDEKGKPVTEKKFGPDYHRIFGRVTPANPLVCSYCFKILRSKEGLDKHIEACFSRFRDNNFTIILNDTKLINLYDDENLLKIIESLSYISKLEQGLDFEPMTSVNAVKRLDKRILCKIIDGRLVGYITFCKRNIAKYRKELWSVEDFFVVKHMRNKGIGQELFEKMLKYVWETRYTITYNRPNEKMIEFLKNIGTDVTKIMV